MSEMNALSFYEKVFEISKRLDLTYIAEKIVLEIDQALRKWNADSDQMVVPHVRNQSPDFFRVDSSSLDQIIEVFRNRPRERDMYLRVFPEYQRNTVRIVNALFKVAENLYEIERFRKPKTYFDAVLGGVAGVLRIGSIFNPLPAALSTVMNLSSLFNGTVQAAFFGVEHIATEKQMVRFEELMGQYKIQFERTVYRWFIYDDLLQKSVKSAIGSETTEKMFNLFNRIRERNSRSGMPVTDIIRHITDVLIASGFSVHVAYPIAAGLAQIFWLHYGSRWMADWETGAFPLERTKTLFVVGSYSAHAGLAHQSLRNPSNSFYSGSLIASAFSAVVDFLPIISDIYQESETIKRVKKIENKADEIKQELDRFNTLHEDLKAEKETWKPIKRILHRLNNLYENLKIILLVIDYLVLIVLGAIIFFIIN